MAGGASVSFMAPLSRDKAQAVLAVTWPRVWRAGGGRCWSPRTRRPTTVVGTVQLVLAQPENQPHRGDIAKMLVHRRARRRGIGAMVDARRRGCCAQGGGKTLLVLDTATGSDAVGRYQRLGWMQVGVIPDYALWPDGRPCATTYYFKRLV